MDKKWTFDEIRLTYDIKIPQWAKTSGLSKQVIYNAVTFRPISIEQAALLVQSLPELTDTRNWSLDEILYNNAEDDYVLWVIRASDESGRFPDKYRLVYAQNEMFARKQVQYWLASLPTHTIHVFTQWTSGFTVGDVRVPGYSYRLADGTQGNNSVQDGKK